MPRFCSSKTRPNSLPIGAAISVATMLKPKARLCPARSARASISRASGSWAAKAFSRRLRRNSSQTSGSDAHQQCPPSGIRAGWMLQHEPPGRIPATASTAEIAASLATVRVVSACSNSRSMLPKRSRNDSSEAGPVVQRLGEDAGLLQPAVLGRPAPRRRSAGRGGPRSCCAGLSRSSKAAAAHQGGDSHKRHDARPAAGLTA